MWQRLLYFASFYFHDSKIIFKKATPVISYPILASRGFYKCSSHRQKDTRTRNKLWWISQMLIVRHGFFVVTHSAINAIITKINSLLPRRVNCTYFTTTLKLPTKYILMFQTFNLINSPHNYPKLKQPLSSPPLNIRPFLSY